MTDRYYSSRMKPKNITIEEFYQKLQSLYLLFRDKSFFKERADITESYLPETIKHEAFLDLGFQLFPITEWAVEDITEDHLFDTLEFLYDRVSKPGLLIDRISDTGYNYFDNVTLRK